MGFGIGKVANPFFSGLKAAGKGVKAAGLSALAVGAYAGGEHFLGELLPIIIGVAIPPPFGALAGLAIASLASGGIGALANLKKNHKITPEQLDALMDAARVAEQLASDEPTDTRLERAQTELRAALEAADNR